MATCWVSTADDYPQPFQRFGYYHEVVDALKLPYLAQLRHISLCQFLPKRSLAAGAWTFHATTATLSFAGPSQSIKTAVTNLACAHFELLYGSGIVFLLVERTLWNRCRNILSQRQRNVYRRSYRLRMLRRGRSGPKRWQTEDAAGMPLAYRRLSGGGISKWIPDRDSFYFLHWSIRDTSTFLRYSPLAGSLAVGAHEARSALHNGACTREINEKKWKEKPLKQWQPAREAGRPARHGAERIVGLPLSANCYRGAVQGCCSCRSGAVVRLDRASPESSCLLSNCELDRNNNCTCSFSLTRKRITESSIETIVLPQSMLYRCCQWQVRVAQSANRDESIRWRKPSARKQLVRPGTK